MENKKIQCHQCQRLRGVTMVKTNWFIGLFVGIFLGSFVYGIFRLIDISNNLTRTYSNLKMLISLIIAFGVVGLIIGSCSPKEKET